MKSSSNPWENLVYEKGLVSSPKTKYEDLKEKVYSTGRYVFLRKAEKVAYSLVNDDFFKS